MTHRIDFDEYRHKRRMVLLKVDEQFNGLPVTETAGDDVQYNEDNLTSPGIPVSQFGAMYIGNNRR